MMNLDVLESADGKVSLPNWKVRLVAEQMVGPIARQTWGDWCRNLNQSGKRTSWLDIDAASALLARAYLASRGVRWYSGDIFEAAVIQGRQYWKNYIGELNGGSGKE